MGTLAVMGRDIRRAVIRGGTAQEVMNGRIRVVRVVRVAHYIAGKSLCIATRRTS